ncbi:MAG: Gfo/Idh/MocA family oxidoreductase [Phycisphaerales bacterium]|nr:Gfo/Idh/MocA family oxidoreductase [Phycisphaerales bacterium]
MPRSHDNAQGNVTRRDFVRYSTLSASALAVANMPALARQNSSTSRPINVGLIGCGGRGTGAAHNALEAHEDVHVVAMADAFPDRLNNSRKSISEHGSGRGKVKDASCYTGFDAYTKLLKDDVDVVILATPPHFRPIHFEAAVDAGKHVFMEKPAAVDPSGIRQVIRAAEKARGDELSVVAGTQRRHERCYLDAMERINRGEIGEITSGRVYWNMGGLWVRQPQEDWSEMEWQLRNWLYFTWLSGDHIVEQHVHNLDVANWVMGSQPVRCMGMGGREVRTGDEYGHIFDHFAVDYEYPNGRHVMSMCRQTDGCASRVEEAFHGTEGRCLLRSGFAQLAGNTPWQFTGKNTNPYVQEHRDLIASIRGQGPYLNEGQRVAESTLTAIMGRMSAYTGKEVSWDQAMNSQLDLSPKAYEFGDIEVPPVAIPGRTPLV